MWIKTYSAKDRSSLCGGDTVGDGSNVAGPGDDVLREGTVNGETGVFAVRANCKRWKESRSDKANN